MATGWDKGYTIEHDPTLKKRVSCKDCNHYDRSDKSCSKTPYYPPENGFNYWKNCNCFELDPFADNHDDKLAQLKRDGRA